MEQVEKRGPATPVGLVADWCLFEGGIPPILLAGTAAVTRCPMDSVARGVVPDGNYVWRDESYVEAGLGSETLESRCIPIGMNDWAAVETSFYSSIELKCRPNRSRSLVLLRAVGAVGHSAPCPRWGWCRAAEVEVWGACIHNGQRNSIA